MSTVLTNGIIIPDNGSRNWGGDLANNWNIIDVNVGYMTDVKNKVTTLENNVAENTANIQTNASNISTLQTSKQDVIEDLETIRTGASSGATAVQPSVLSNYYTKTEVETELASKANDADVVHKSGDTVSGDLLGVGSNNLGTSTNKWKTLNEINPGALSLPNCGDRVKVISQVVNTDGAFQYTNNLYDGWLVVTALADNAQIANQYFECRAVKSIDNVVTAIIPLRFNETASIRFTNFTRFAYVNLFSCSGNA